MSSGAALALGDVLIALDVDGTLLRSDGSLSGRTVAALGAAQASGARLCLATGRDWHAVAGLLEEMPAVDYALCVNGIEVFGRDGAQLHADALDPDAAAQAVVVLRRAVPGLSFGAGISGDLVGEPGLSNAMPPGVADPIEVVDILDHLGPGLRDIVLYHADLSGDLERFHAVVSRALVGHDRVQVAFTGLPMIELVPPGAGKDTGLAWLADHLAVERSKVVAFGDGRNDLGMLAWAGTGVAMGQATDEVKSNADMITLPVDDDGVAHWIEQALG